MNRCDRNIAYCHFAASTSERASFDRDEILLTVGQSASALRADAWNRYNFHSCNNLYFAFCERISLEFFPIADCTFPLSLFLLHFIIRCHIAENCAKWQTRYSLCVTATKSQNHNSYSIYVMPNFSSTALSQDWLYTLHGIYGQSGLQITRKDRVTPP